MYKNCTLLLALLGFKDNEAHQDDHKFLTLFWPNQDDPFVVKTCTMKRNAMTPLSNIHTMCRIFWSLFTLHTFINNIIVFFMIVNSHPPIIFHLTLLKASVYFSV